MKRIVILAAAAMAVSAMSARLGTAGSISTTTADGRVVTVTAINPNVLRVTNVASFGEQPLPSEAIVAERGTYAATTQQIGKFITTLVTENGITATVDDRTGFLTISSGEGRVITDCGARPVDGQFHSINLSTTSRGSIYGAGERGHRLNLRGDTLVQFNRQNYGYTGSDPRISQMGITMPLFIASDGFAVVFDDYARSRMVVDNTISYITENERPVTYYYVAGAATIADVTEQLSAITGRQELPPFWSMGYITSRYGYRTQDETLGVIDTLKRDGYPVDGIVLDLYWYGREQDMGRLAWDPDQWPDPERMLRQLHDRGVNLVAISQPYVLRNGRGLDNYNALSADSLLLLDSAGRTQEVKIWVGEGGMFDVSNPATKQWLANRYELLTNMGIEGWWGDLGEPEVHPLTGLHHNGIGAANYHNQYGNDWSRIIFDMFKAKFPNRRLMTMMRGGTIGLQRSNVFPWSTDVSRSWGGLEPQIRIMIQSGLSGLGYMSHDVGGFAVDRAQPFMPELYVRWLQLGLFSPILRTHAQEFAEPYNYPEYSRQILDIIKQRYRWLPYNYTLAWENASKGYPLVRPLNFTDPDNTYDHISDQYLWGSEVMVAPVLTAGATSRQITFPTGLWFDFNENDRAYQGGTVVDYPVDIQSLPLFVRAGAFLPLADYAMENTGDYNPSQLTVHYFPAEGVDSQFVLFDDDRTSTGTLAAGSHREITFSGRNNGRSIEVRAEGSYPNAPREIALTIVVHRAANAATFRVNGRNMRPKLDESANTLTLRVKWPVDRALIIESTNLKLCSQE